MMRKGYGNDEERIAMYAALGSLEEEQDGNVLLFCSSALEFPSLPSPALEVVSLPVLSATGR